MIRGNFNGPDGDVRAWAAPHADPDGHLSLGHLREVALAGREEYADEKISALLKKHNIHFDPRDIYKIIRAVHYGVVWLAIGPTPIYRTPDGGLPPIHQHDYDKLRKALHNPAYPAMRKLAK